MSIRHDFFKYQRTILPDLVEQNSSAMPDSVLIVCPGTRRRDEPCPRKSRVRESTWLFPGGGDGIQVNEMDQLEKPLPEHIVYEERESEEKHEADDDESGPV